MGHGNARNKLVLDTPGSLQGYSSTRIPLRRIPSFLIAPPPAELYMLDMLILESGVFTESQQAIILNIVKAMLNLTGASVTRLSSTCSKSSGGRARRVPIAPHVR